MAESPPSPQEGAKRRKAIFERWVAKQAHELKGGEPNIVGGELKRLLTLMQQCRAGGPDGAQESDVPQRAPCHAGLCGLPGTG